MARVKERPGVVLYFDTIRPVIKRLSDAQCGTLLRSVIEYAQYGVVPELDAMTGMAFDLLVPKIDRDAERYEESREQRQYAAYTREKKKNGEDCLSYADWRLERGRTSENENIGPMQPEDESADPYPSTSTTTSTTTSPATTATTSTSTTASASKNKALSAEAAKEETGEGCRGEAEGEAKSAYRQWIAALDQRNREESIRMKCRLYTLGYDADPVTRQLFRRRDYSPGSPPGIPDPKRANVTKL